MVGGRDDRERHRERHRERKRSHGKVRRRLEEDNADEEVPARVQAREGRVLVRQRRRLERSIALRVLRDRVDDPGISKARRSHGKRREEAESDQARDEHRVPEQDVALAAPGVERDPAGGDHRPVAVDIDPVRGGHEPVMLDDQILQVVFPGDPEVALGAPQPAGIGEGTADPVLGEAADAEVDEHRDGDQAGLSRDRRDHKWWARDALGSTLAAGHALGIGRGPEAPSANYGRCGIAADTLRPHTDAMRRSAPESLSWHVRQESRRGL